MSDSCGVAGGAAHHVGFLPGPTARSVKKNNINNKNDEKTNGHRETADAEKARRQETVGGNENRAANNSNPTTGTPRASSNIAS